MTGAAARAGLIPLRVLIVEDSEEDSDLIVLELRRGGFEPVCRRVDDSAALRNALDQAPWDVVLSDFSLPRFSVAEALRMVQQTNPELPFVIVSATIGEEAAVEAMRAGAQDYILKHRLGRLVPAVQRELRESEVRRERRNLEDQLRHAQKLESLGLLAGGVAHDFNNLLTGILGNASLVREMVGSDSESGRMLGDVVRAAERAADLTRQLLAYAGKGKFVVERVDASALVRSISDLLRSSVPRSVELKLELQPELPVIEGDPSQFQQLIMNLILNAVEATGERPGVVSVRTAVRDIRTGDNVAHFRPAAPEPGQYVAIEVADDGCGMSGLVQGQIFDPFFTTKFTGRGLGLAAALGIVRGHGGAIGVQSLEGQGSCFTVLLPVAAGAPPSAGQLADADLIQASSAGTILIVDDEDVVRHAARATLEHSGYTVFEACDGQDGADLFDRLHDRVSAVLLDWTMPHMGGYELWQHIRRRRPEMPVIISSGFDRSEALAQFGEDSGVEFLQKPYTAATLVRKIQAMLRE